MPLIRTALYLRSEGTPPPPGDRGVIFAPNHAGWLDPYLVQYAIYPQRMTFLMTELYFDLPVVGLYFRAAGARAIREEGPSVSALRAARAGLEAGELICIFPEGEITRTGEMGPGRRGVARLAQRTGALVVPVGVRGSGEVWSRMQPKPRLFRRVSVHIGEPMAYDEEPGREGEARFTDRLMARIRDLAEGS